MKNSSGPFNNNCNYKSLTQHLCLLHEPNQPKYHFNTVKQIPTRCYSLYRGNNNNKKKHYYHTVQGNYSVRGLVFTKTPWVSVGPGTQIDESLPHEQWLAGKSWYFCFAAGWCQNPLIGRSSTLRQVINTKPPPNEHVGYYILETLDLILIPTLETSLCVHIC